MVSKHVPNFVPNFQFLDEIRVRGTVATYTYTMGISNFLGDHKDGMNDADAFSIGPMGQKLTGTAAHQCVGHGLRS